MSSNEPTTQKLKFSTMSVTVSSDLVAPLLGEDSVRTDQITAVTKATETKPQPTQASFDLLEDPVHRKRFLIALIFPTLATLGWLIYVLAAGQLHRAVQHYDISIMMIGGSFLAGSSPEGGGAVAFPVLTKVLGVKPPAGRLFILAAQSVGLSVASIFILITKRPLDLNLLKCALPTGIAGLGVGLGVLADHDKFFWPPIFPAVWVKVTFAIVLASIAVALCLLVYFRRHGHVYAQSIPFNIPIAVVLGLLSFVGGIVASLTGTGVNVTMFLFAVLVCNLSPKVAVPTSVVTMAIVSVVGIMVLGLDGDLLDTEFDPQGRVIRIGHNNLPKPCPASKCDVQGFFLAAIPIIVWGAPAGALVAAKVGEATLVLFVALLATVEVISTWVLVKELHHPNALVFFFVAGLVSATIGVFALFRYQEDLLRKLKSFSESSEKPTSNLQSVQFQHDDL